MRLLSRLFLLRLIFRPILSLILGVRFINTEELGKHKQYIIVANHNSHIDTTALLCALPPKMLNRVYPMAAGDYFNKNWLFSKFVHYFYNIATIDRKRKSENPLDQFEEMLSQGKSLIIFPEGSRGQPNVMQPFRRGVGILLTKFPEVGFIPVYAENFGEIMPKGDGVLVPHDSSITIGEYSLAPKGTPEEITTYVFEKVQELANK
jgi:1-acyl-sn-glycerol-3-phosphate acyltransferase